ncbi:MAG: PPOX class F420-dependent oxidoreductase [Actinomycetota bacterium]|nr:PPOX class F420-dependent oxidoreductase [Actinomycetota bacterium]
MRCAAETGALAPLARSGTALLTTFRRGGAGVRTPVTIALDGGRAYFITSAGGGKAARLARCDRVRLAPCPVGGTSLGDSVAGRARLLGGAEPRRVRWLLRPIGPLWSYLLYRMRGHTMHLYEVVPVRICSGDR